jgi:hypothetical protein
MLPDLELKTEDIASHATAHATTRTDCQLEVLKLLRQGLEPLLSDDIEAELSHRHVVRELRQTRHRDRPSQPDQAHRTGG